MIGAYPAPKAKQHIDALCLDWNRGRGQSGRITWPVCLPTTFGLIECNEPSLDIVSKLSRRITEKATTTVQTSLHMAALWWVRRVAAYALFTANSRLPALCPGTQPCVSGFWPAVGRHRGSSSVLVPHSLKERADLHQRTSGLLLSGPIKLRLGLHQAQDGRQSWRLRLIQPAYIGATAVAKIDKASLDGVLGRYPAAWVSRHPFAPCPHRVTPSCTPPRGRCCTSVTIAT